MLTTFHCIKITFNSNTNSTNKRRSFRHVLNILLKLGMKLMEDFAFIPIPISSILFTVSLWNQIGNIPVIIQSISRGQLSSLFPTNNSSSSQNFFVASSATLAHCLTSWMPFHHETSRWIQLMNNAVGKIGSKDPNETSFQSRASWHFSAGLLALIPWNSIPVSAHIVSSPSRKLYTFFSLHYFLCCRPRHLFSNKRHSMKGESRSATLHCSITSRNSPQNCRGNDFHKNIFSYSSCYSASSNLRTAQ